MKYLVLLLTIISANLAAQSILTLGENYNVHTPKKSQTFLDQVLEFDDKLVFFANSFHEPSIYQPSSDRIIVTTKNGKVFADFYVGYESDGYLVDMVKASDTTFIVCFLGFHPKYYDRVNKFDLILVEYDLVGNALWTQAYPTKSHIRHTVRPIFQRLYMNEHQELFLSSAMRIPDTEPNVAPEIGKFDLGVGIIKFNRTGELLWLKRFGGSEKDEILSHGLNQNGGLTFIVDPASTDGDLARRPPNTHGWVLELDRDGNIHREKFLPKQEVPIFQNSISFGSSYFTTVWKKAPLLLQPNKDQYFSVGMWYSKDTIIATTPDTIFRSRDIFATAIDINTGQVQTQFYGGSLEETVKHIHKIPGKNEIFIVAATESTDGDMADFNGNNIEQHFCFSFAPDLSISEKVLLNYPTDFSLSESEYFGTINHMLFLEDGSLLGHGSSDYEPWFTYIEKTNTNSIASPNKSASFKVYPNPASHQISVSGIVQSSAPRPYRITNTMGKTVLDGTLQNQTAISTSALKPGLYILQIPSTENAEIPLVTSFIKK